MKKIITMGLSVLFLASCQSYKALELEPEKILSELEQQRSNALKGDKLTFAEAARVMDQNNLQLQEVRKRYIGLQKIADIATPLPNPVITGGPAKGSRLEDTSSSSTQPFIGIAFSIPLGPRLRRNDELNQLQVLAAWNRQVLQHRKLYFELKKTYQALHLSRELNNLQKELDHTLALSQQAAEKLLEIGMASKLGINEVNLIQWELKLEQIDLEGIKQKQMSELSELLVMSEAVLETAELEKIPSKATEIEFSQFKNTMILNNAELAKAEMDFHIADAELRIELAKQYPDLEIGFDFEQEVGEDKRTYAVPLSMELPLFDRNQQGIASANQNRENKLLNYKKVLNQKLSELKQIHVEFQLSRQKLAIIENDLLPLSKENLDDARKALELGTIDILRYLDITQDHQQLQVKALLMKIGDLGKLSTLEQICGLPLDSQNFTDVQLKKMEIEQ